MKASEENVNQLAKLLKDGYTVFRRHFPNYQPRETDEGYFDLMVQSSAHPSRSHNKWFKRWYEEVEKHILSLEDDYYIQRFRSIEFPRNINVLAPDAYYFVLKELQKIVGELKQIQRGNVAVTEDKQHFKAKITYSDPYLILHIEGTDEAYILYSFRKGKAKKAFEITYKKPDRTSNKSEFRGGSLHGFSISKSFETLFKNLKSHEFTKYIPLHQWIEINPNQIKITGKELILDRDSIHKVTENHKKLS